MTIPGFAMRGRYDGERTGQSRARQNGALSAPYGAPFYTEPVDIRETRMYARMSTEAPRVPWDRFITEELEFRSGEHFAMIGPTGQGKTTMLLNILPLHKYVTVFATKPRDETMDALIQSAGYVKLEHWRSLNPKQFPRRVIWPDATRLASRARQRAVFHHAFGAIYREGGWTLALDETWYVGNILKLTEDVRTFLLQARALEISLICATQRPAWVPVEIYDMSTHIMFWRDNDERNLSRMSGISYLSADLVRNLVARLEPHQVLYINTRTGRMLRTRCPAPEILAQRKGRG